MADKKFKQLVFNDLTLKPFCSNETEMYQRVSLYVHTLKALKENLGTHVIRYSTDLSAINLSDSVNLRDFCKKHCRDAGMIAILSSHTMPLVHPDDTEKMSDSEDLLVSVNVNGETLLSSGLNAAYVYDVPSVGFASSDYWSNVMHDIQVVLNGNKLNVFWPCITNPKHLNQSDFKTWISNRSEISLVTSSRNYSEKIRGLDESLRDDHGKDVLKEHAQRLCNCEYVEGILCSRPFSPSCRTYVKNVLEGGLIDIVLFWDDRGLSMRVKTTGRTLQETNVIASFLKDKYSK